MSKPSPLLVKLNTEYERKLKLQRLFTLQMTLDAATLAVHELFGAGPERLHQFEQVMSRKYNDIAEMTHNDAKDDKHIVYTKATLDAALKQCCGKYFAPWDERYR